MTLTAQQLTIYGAVVAAAATGEVCPTNATLGALIERDPKSAGAMLGQLAALGVIVVSSSGGSRTVRIVATEQETRKPERNAHLTGRVMPAANDGAWRDAAERGCAALLRAQLRTGQHNLQTADQVRDAWASIERIAA